MTAECKKLGTIEKVSTLRWLSCRRIDERWRAAVLAECCLFNFTPWTPATRAACFAAANVCHDPPPPVMCRVCCCVMPPPPPYPSSTCKSSCHWCSFTQQVRVFTLALLPPGECAVTTAAQHSCHDKQAQQACICVLSLPLCSSPGSCPPLLRPPHVFPLHPEGVVRMQLHNTRLDNPSKYCGKHAYVCFVALPLPCSPPPPPRFACSHCTLRVL